MNGPALAPHAGEAYDPVMSGRLRTSFEEAIRDALAREATLDELCELLREHRDRGLTQRAAYRALQELRPTMDAPAEDALLEVMDVVSGWCAPARRVWSGEMGGEDA